MTTDIKLFELTSTSATEIPGEATAVEKSLHRLIERNLEVMLGIRLLGIDWTAPRLLCIAGGYTRYDEHAVEQMNRNIELVRYRRFGKSLLMLEMVNAISVPPVGGDDNGPTTSYKTISQTLKSLEGPLLDLYQAA